MDKGKRQREKLMEKQMAASIVLSCTAIWGCLNCARKLDSPRKRNWIKAEIAKIGELLAGRQVDSISLIKPSAGASNINILISSLNKPKR